MSVTVTGIPELQRDLGRLEGTLRAGLTTELGRAATRIQSQAKADAPIDMGALRDSIRTEVDEREASASVGSDAHYARFIEFGTGPMGKNSHLDALAEQARVELGYEYGPKGGFPPIPVMEAWCQRHGIPVEAAFAIALTIRRRGTRAQPFLYPAVEAEAVTLPSRLDARLRELLR